MEIKERPITNKSHPFRKLLNDLVLKDLPIHQWEQGQKEVRRKIKL